MRFEFAHSDSLPNEILSTDKLTIEFMDSEFTYMHYLGTIYIYISMAKVVLSHLLKAEPCAPLWLDRGLISNHWYLHLNLSMVNPVILNLKEMLAPTKDFDFLYELYKFLSTTEGIPHD